MADYGVVLATRLATLSGEELRSVTALAGETGIPQPTVGKILKLLGREGLLASTRGAQGGYRLSRRPEDVNVADVIAALEGISLAEMAAPAAPVLVALRRPERGQPEHGPEADGRTS